MTKVCFCWNQIFEDSSRDWDQSQHCTTNSKKQFEPYYEKLQAASEVNHNINANNENKMLERESDNGIQSKRVE